MSESNEDAQAEVERMATLAAAIDVDKQRRLLLETGSETAEDAVVRTEERLRRALSALRGRS